MVVNFKTREISRGTCKLAKTLTLIKKIKNSSNLIIRNIAQLVSFEFASNKSLV
jgi:hypothetical protein